MLEQFFQIGPAPFNQMTGIYDIRLVILSYLVASSASYIALDTTSRLRDLSNTQLNIALWLCGGAFAMGAGIWSMHFIGMLAFRMDMPMSYDPYWTGLSMLVAIGASGFALFLLKTKIITLWHIVLGGIILGFAIAAMHYTGMAAMTNVKIHYIPGIFALSILIAVAASEAAIFLSLKSTEVLPSIRTRLKFVSALVMGAAIAGMHYTGMAAAIFTPSHMTQVGIYLDPEIMAISIATVTFVILGIAFILSAYRESVNQQLLLTARQAGMAEVAASVLHNVGNVLNSVNVSASIIDEKINQAKISEISQLSKMLDEHKNDLDTFITKDPIGADIPLYLNKLSAYWQKEREIIANETKNLILHIDHIKKIISTQQDLSKIASSEQVVSIQNVLEESLLISGIEINNYGIQFERNYAKLKPVLVDKVKLLQILVNLVQNAKESLQASGNPQKILQLTIDQTSTNFCIRITDNGVGISHENLTKIFMYGFTTKTEGHGFGLHTSAISAKEMGGTLKAQSPGLGKGATFSLCLPYKKIE